MIATGSASAVSLDGPTRSDRWLERMGDRLNPILVREVRQWLRSWHFIGMFLLMVGTCWFTAMFEVAVPRSLTGLVFQVPVDQFRPDGRSLFAFYFLVLTATTFITVPITAFFNFSREFADDAIEMLRVTPLDSAQIAWGKLQTALLQMALYFAAVGPFIALTYLLQGIGLLTIGLGLVLVGIGGTSLAILGMALGSFSRSVGWQVMNLLLLVGGIIISLLIFVGFGFAFTQLTNIAELLGGFLCLTVVGVFAMVIGMGITISNVRPNAGIAKVPFVNHRQLRRIAANARDFAHILRDHFPLAGAPREWDPATSEAFPAIHQEAMARAIAVDRALFEIRPSHGDRNRYMTYSFARQALAEMLRTFDLLLFEQWWNDLSSGHLTPRGCRMRANGTPAVSDVTPALLDTLESSAAAIERICLENFGPERLESIPEADATHPVREPFAQIPPGKPPD